MKRQGLKLTIKELRDLANELEKDFPVKGYAGTNQVRHLVSIVNEEDLSDTWELEK